MDDRPFAPTIYLAPPPLEKWVERDAYSSSELLSPYPPKAGAKYSAMKQMQMNRASMVTVRSWG